MGIEAFLTNSRRDRSGEPIWRRAGVVILLLLCLLAALYWDIVYDMVLRWWEDPDYSHGFLVPLFCGFLIWKRRHALTTLSPHGSWLGFSVLLVGVGALLLGRIGAEHFLMRSSLLLILAGLVLFHLGFDIFVYSGALALMVAFATISIQVIRSALTNPVEALRYE